MTKNIIKFGIAKKYIEDYVGNESWQLLQFPNWSIDDYL